MIGRMGIVLGTLYCLNMAEPPSPARHEAPPSWQPLLVGASGLAGLCAGHGARCQRMAADAADHLIREASRPKAPSSTQQKAEGISPQPVDAPLPPHRTMQVDRQALKRLVERAI